jgi:hypothetical protein
MQLQCSYCNKMFVVKKEAALAGLYAIDTEGLQHYDADCYYCQRANRVSSERMLQTFPNWKEEYEAMLKEAEDFKKKQAALEKGLAERKEKPKKEKKKRSRKR